MATDNTTAHPQAAGLSGFGLAPLAGQTLARNEKWISLLLRQFAVWRDISARVVAMPRPTTLARTAMSSLRLTLWP